MPQNETFQYQNSENSSISVEMGDEYCILISEHSGSSYNTAELKFDSAKDMESYLLKVLFHVSKYYIKKDHMEKIRASTSDNSLLSEAERIISS